MKKFSMQKSIIVIVQVEYCHKNCSSREVFKSFIEKFPEYANCKYEDEYIGLGKSVLNLYREEASDFVEM